MYITNRVIDNSNRAITKPSEIISFAKQHNLPAIGICHFSSTQNFLDFSGLATSEGVTAILAVDTFVMFKNRKEEVLLICKNNQSLLEINKALSTSDGISPIDYDQLPNTIVIFKNYHLDDIHSKDYRGITHNQLPTLETEVTSDMLLIDDTYFATKNDYDFYRVYNAIKTKKSYRHTKLERDRNSYLKLESEDNRYYEALYNNYLKLASQIEALVIEDGFKMPKYTDSKITDNKAYLYKLLTAGLKKRLGANVSSQYIERLNYEFNVISQMGFIDYFLIVWDILKFCHSSGIYVGTGRGSAGGSLVAYCLGVSSVDPVAKGLLFERFLNPKRATMPDIDIDFEDARRDEVFEYITNHYGADHTCRMSNVSNYKAKSAFIEVSRVFDIPKTTTDKVVKLIDSSKSFRENLKTNKKLYQSFMAEPLLQHCLDHIYRLDGMAERTKPHTSGIVISDSPIYNYTTVINNVATSDVKTLEQMGLVKFDILSISYLREYRKFDERIKELTGEEVNFKTFDLTDEKVYTAIGDNMTAFGFQISTNLMHRVMPKFKPKSIDELAVVNALGRPGPVENLDEYIARKDGKKSFDYPIASLKPVLENTYGIIVYQEQVMQIVQVLANYDLGEADLFRRAVSKKNNELLQAELDKFKQAAVANGYQPDEIEVISSQISKFADYGFNKSHAYCYAMMSYAGMYYKVNYPEVYYSYMLANKADTTSIESIERELRYFKLKVAAPDIYNLTMDAQLVDGKIQFGLNNIKLLDKNFKEKLYKYVTERGTEDITSIVDNVICQAELSSKVVDNLIGSGLFRNTEYNQRTLIEHIATMDDSVDIDAFQFISVVSSIEKLENYPIEKLEELERASLQLNINYNSYGTYMTKLRKINSSIIDYDLADKNKLYNTFTTLIQVISVREYINKRDVKMAFVTFRVKQKEHEATVFSEVLDVDNEKLLTFTGYAIVEMKVNKLGLNITKIYNYGR